MGGDEAENLLKGKKPGTYLIRFSSQPGFFAGSYVDQSKQVGKCLIATKPYYYIADNQASQYGHFASVNYPSYDMYEYIYIYP